MNSITKTAIVTGAGSGLAVAHAFVREGANVVLNGRSEDKLAPAANVTEYIVEELDGFLGYLRGTFILSQAAVRQMRKQDHGGAIVNIGTILTSNGVYGLPSSAPIAAKGGITALTRNLAVELAGESIRINAVAPGVVPTPLYGERREDRLEVLHGMQPLGRYGTLHDIAHAVLYLANATWLTGVILPVDGGVDAGGDGTYHGTEETAVRSAA